MPDPIRIAIVGTGLIVTSKHWPALRALPRDFRVIALVNRTPAKAEALAEAIHAATRHRPAVYADYRQMLAAEKPDAVTLALPPDLNPEIAQAALAVGSHVIAEKPIAVSLAEGARMLPWAAQYRRVLMIAENYRYVASYRSAAQLIAEGAIGPPRVMRWTIYAYMAQDNPYYLTAWRQNPRHPGGYLSDQGVHNMAALRMLLGEVTHVSGLALLVRPDLLPADTLSATLRFASGCLGTYAATHAVPGPEQPLQVAGPDGALSIWRDRVGLWRQGRPVEERTMPSEQDGLVEMYRDFSEAIRTGQSPRSTPAEALADLRLVVAMLRASDLGQEVPVAKIPT